jgi:hypothetical protein
VIGYDRYEISRLSGCAEPGGDGIEHSAFLISCDGGVFKHSAELFAFL